MISWAIRRMIRMRMMEMIRMIKMRVIQMRPKLMQMWRNHLLHTCSMNIVHTPGGMEQDQDEHVKDNDEEVKASSSSMISMTKSFQNITAVRHPNCPLWLYKPPQNTPNPVQRSPCGQAVSHHDNPVSIHPPPRPTLLNFFLPPNHVTETLLIYRVL